MNALSVWELVDHHLISAVNDLSRSQFGYRGGGGGGGIGA